MTEERIAFIIPIHGPNFKFMYALKNKIDIINKCCDIFLIFSNETEYDEFIYKEEFKHLILPKNYKTNSIVTFKKFYGLNTLKNDYSYFITCDSEIDIIDENFTHENIMNKINDFYNAKKIFCGIVPRKKPFMEITEKCCTIFKNDDDKNKLKKLTNDYKTYYWWSDIPVYKASHIDDFFSKINNDSNIVWHHFDHKIYVNYLILYHGFKFINVKPLINWNYGGLELYNDEDENNLKILKQHDYTFSWITPRLFKMHKEYLTNNGSFMLFHIDWHN